MSDYIENRARKHKVKHTFSNRNHIFEVKTENEDHDVAIKVSCDCKFMGVQGVANNKICSHILAVFQKIVEEGEIHASKDKKE